MATRGVDQGKRPDHIWHAWWKEIVGNEDRIRINWHAEYADQFAKAGVDWHGSSSESEDDEEEKAFERLRARKKFRPRGGPLLCDRCISKHCARKPMKKRLDKAQPSGVAPLKLLSTPLHYHGVPPPYHDCYGKAPRPYWPRKQKQPSYYPWKKSFQGVGQGEGEFPSSGIQEYDYEYPIKRSVLKSSGIYKETGAIKKHLKGKVGRGYVMQPLNAIQPDVILGPPPEVPGNAPLPAVHKFPVSPPPSAEAPIRDNLWRRGPMQNPCVCFDKKDKTPPSTATGSKKS